MFKKRELRVSLEKPEKQKTENPQTNELDFEDKVYIIADLTKRAAKTAFYGLCAYVVLDTWRQVQVAKNTQVPSQVVYKT